jgi:homeobox-leucine zipper protein
MDLFNWYVSDLHCIDICLNFVIFVMEVETDWEFDYTFQMHAEIQLPSPLVPVQEYNFIRFCKQHAEGKWAVVDVSFDYGRNGPNGNPNISCKKLPSGCILQDMPNGFCKVTNCLSISNFIH